MRERSVPHIMQQCSQADLLLLLSRQVDREAFRDHACKVHGAENMFEPCVVRSWVDKFRPRQLPDPTQPLDGQRVDDLPFNFCNSDVPVNWILDEAPKLLSRTQLDITIER